VIDRDLSKRGADGERPSVLWRGTECSMTHRRAKKNKNKNTSMFTSSWSRHTAPPRPLTMIASSTWPTRHAHLDDFAKSAMQPNREAIRASRDLGVNDNRPI